MQGELQRAWVQQAQADAERGVIECRMCRRPAGLDETTTLWRNGLLVLLPSTPVDGHQVTLGDGHRNGDERPQRRDGHQRRARWIRMAEGHRNGAERTAL
jgi:hypothetical protein